MKRGREDGLLRTMHTDKLLKTIPILQNQIDALLEFSVTTSELNNGVINCSFILLFRDLIRLFACYNDGIINVLEKYFDMNKKQCRDALDTYKVKKYFFFQFKKKKRSLKLNFPNFQTFSAQQVYINFEFSNFMQILVFFLREKVMKI